jgi:hypothetical protein
MRYWLIGLTIVAVAGMLLLVQSLTPQETNPAFAVATTFMNAAEQGKDAVASALLSDALQDYVQTHCTEARVSACIQSYSPPEWGTLLNAVFRRAAPDGKAWDVDLIATYEQGAGVSGVCSYFRVEPDADGEWRIQRWAGFIWCGDPASRNMATNPDTPNRAP